MSLVVTVWPEKFLWFYRFQSLSDSIISMIYLSSNIIVMLYVSIVVLLITMVRL